MIIFVGFDEKMVLEVERVTPYKNLSIEWKDFPKKIDRKTTRIVVYDLFSKFPGGRVTGGRVKLIQDELPHTNIPIHIFVVSDELGDLGYMLSGPPHLDYSILSSDIQDFDGTDIAIVIGNRYVLSQKKQF